MSDISLSSQKDLRSQSANSLRKESILFGSVLRSVLNLVHTLVSLRNLRLDSQRLFFVAVRLCKAYYS